MPNPHPNTSGLAPGGKSLTGNGEHSPRISLALPADWKRRLDAEAGARGIGTAKLVREIIADWLNQHP